jgi:hypothetical protein
VPNDITSAVISDLIHESEDAIGDKSGLLHPFFEEGMVQCPDLNRIARKWLNTV